MLDDGESVPKRRFDGASRNRDLESITIASVRRSRTPEEAAVPDFESLMPAMSLRTSQEHDDDDAGQESEMEEQLQKLTNALHRTPTVVQPSEQREPHDPCDPESRMELERKVAHKLGSNRPAAVSSWSPQGSQSQLLDSPTTSWSALEMPSLWLSTEGDAECLSEGDGTILSGSHSAVVATDSGLQAGCWNPFCCGREQPAGIPDVPPVRQAAPTRRAYTAVEERLTSPRGAEGSFNIPGNSEPIEFTIDTPPEVWQRMNWIRDEQARLQERKQLTQADSAVALKHLLLAEQGSGEAAPEDDAEEQNVPAGQDKVTTWWHSTWSDTV